MQGRVHRKTLQEHDRHMIEAMLSNNRVMHESVRDEYVKSAVARNGVLPYLDRPSARVSEEIQEVMKGFGMTRESAIHYIRSQVPQTEEVNGGI